MSDISLSQEQLKALLARAASGEDLISITDSVQQNKEQEQKSMEPTYGRKQHILIGDDEEDNRDDEWQLRGQMRKLERHAISIRHQNQRKAANDIISEFTQDRNTLLVAAVGKTQSGKTGVMYSLIMEATNTSVDGYVPVANVFVITGLSSNEWKDQTKSRLPEILRENVFHRSELNKGFKEKINGKKNILIIVDEIQIACQLKQSLHKSFSDILDTKYMIENDIKIVEFSATPNGTYGNLEDWEGHYKTVKVHPGLGYVGHKELYEQGRLFQCRDLTIQKHVEELYEKIQELYETSKYHIIRTKVGGGQDECVEVFKRVVGDEFNYLYHDSENLESIDNILDKQPEKHTVIFLKEMARCAKTFKKEFIGVWYERYVKSFCDDIAVQGLAGRATGYDDNGVSIVYTNMESMRRFIDLWEKDFSPEVPWNSNTTKYSERKQKTISKKTVNSALKRDDVPLKDEEIEVDPEIIPFDNGGNGFTSFEDLKKQMKDIGIKNIGKKACMPREGGTDYYISSKVAGSVEKAKDDNNRLFLKNVKKFIRSGANIDKNAKSKQAWIVYPVYKDETTAPNDVLWFGKAWMKKV